MNKQILDMTCGARTMWFDKNEPHTIYCDKRKETYYNVWGSDKAERKLIVNPDVQCDFTELPFPDNSFSLVLFDPPHLIHAKETAWLVKNTESWMSHGLQCYMMVSQKECVFWHQTEHLYSNGQSTIFLPIKYGKP